MNGFPLINWGKQWWVHWWAASWDCFHQHTCFLSVISVLLFTEKRAMSSLVTGTQRGKEGQVFFGLSLGWNIYLGILLINLWFTYFGIISTYQIFGKYVVIFVRDFLSKVLFGMISFSINLTQFFKGHCKPFTFALNKTKKYMPVFQNVSPKAVWNLSTLILIAINQNILFKCRKD
jgi:hypothetical protein